MHTCSDYKVRSNNISMYCTYKQFLLNFKLCKQTTTVANKSTSTYILARLRYFYKIKHSILPLVSREKEVCKQLNWGKTEFFVVRAILKIRINSTSTKQSLSLQNQFIMKRITSVLLILVEAPLTLARKAYPIHIKRQTLHPFRMERMYNMHQSSSSTTTKSVYINPESVDTVRDLVEGEELIVPTEGDPACPCLSVQDIPPFTFTSEYEGELAGTLDESLQYYGIGCNNHDQISNRICIDGCPTNDTACDRSWCERKFCYVDSENCSLQYKTSVYAIGRSYSYATCRYMDTFSDSARIKSLAGMKLKIGMNSNFGGYRGYVDLSQDECKTSHRVTVTPACSLTNIPPYTVHTTTIIHILMGLSVVGMAQWWIL